MKPSAQMKELADRLLRSRIPELTGAKDVLIWYTGRGDSDGSQIGIALHGDALRIKRYALMKPVRNPDLDMQRALGFPAEVRATSTGTYPVDQYFPAGDVFAADLLDGIGLAAKRFLKLDDEALVYATFIPSAGAPWSPENSPTAYYSAKKKRVLTTPEPPWLVEVQGYSPHEERDVEALGADFCQLAPRVESCNIGAIVGAFEGKKPIEFSVTHSLSLEDEGRISLDNAKAIRECGGLLFPSLAVGLVPATNFGELVLVADLGVALQSLRPYKAGRGRWPVAVYETDTWTATTTTFVGDGAVEYFRELTGSPDTNWIYTHDFWSLGPPLRDDQAELLTSTKKLRTVLNQRAKLYKRSLDRAGLEAVRYGRIDSPDKYAYVEAKSNGILALDCFPFAVCPAERRQRAAAFLSTAGWDGTLLTLDVPTPSPYVSDDSERDPQWDYGWMVRDALSEFAAAEGHVEWIRT